MDDNEGRLLSLDGILILSIVILLVISTVVLYSIAPSIYPLYFVFLVLGFIAFYVFLKIDFEVFLLFSPHFYVLSVILLLLPLIIGQATRGAIRWIPIGNLTIQPSEVVRPFLLLFFARYITEKEFTGERLAKILFFFLIPLILILVQPSLGVAVLTGIGFTGVLLASSINKKYFLIAPAVLLLISPLIWTVMPSYQKARVTSFVDPSSDPQGAGYNSIQSMISVGSGGIFGRGLGEGVQTQLAFLPEKHTDFIFAATAEELGMVGSFLILLGLFTVFWILIKIIERAKSQAARAYVSGVFFVLFAESLIHVGMNMGLFPITGVPLPFVSAGGSALLGTMMSVAIALNAKRRI